MTKISEETIVCANCKKQSNHKILWSTSSFGYMDLDTRSAGRARYDNLYSSMQKCPHCGYVGADISNEEDYEEVKNFIKNKEYEEIAKNAENELVEIFLKSSYLNTMQKNYPSAMVNTLSCAWLYDDGFENENDQSFFKKANKYRTLAIKIYDDNFKNITIKNLHQALIKLDMLRRVQNFTQADEFANKIESFLNSLSQNEKQEVEFLANIVSFEKQLIQNKDWLAHTIEGALN